MTLSSAFRWTLGCAAAGALLFGAAGAFQSVRAGPPLGIFLQPTTAFAALGGTVGGLLGPLIGGIVSRRRQQRSRPAE